MKVRGPWLGSSPELEAVLDSNLLLLWMAGKVDPPLWNWKRIQMFDTEDARLLNRLLARFSRLATTPHVLTEVSNFANQLHGPPREMLFHQIAAFAGGTVEHYRFSSSLSVCTEFTRFGITDCALCDIGPSSTVLTTDFRLAGYLRSLNRSVVNFNTLRQSRLLR